MLLVQDGDYWTWKFKPVVQYSLGITFCYWNFYFHVVKTPDDANIGIIAILVYFKKLYYIHIH